MYVCMYVCMYRYISKHWLGRVTSDLFWFISGSVVQVELQGGITQPVQRLQRFLNLKRGLEILGLGKFVHFPMKFMDIKVTTMAILFCANYWHILSFCNGFFKAWQVLLILTNSVIKWFILLIDKPYMIKR